ncbi:uncharacterized protein [Parasteatoda tepidariorum]|uniref:uncharacterized protein n=1 Tax=Parasteatoda tepidariorum TaxID=114398 RepID=UPI001C719067|nr:uncharacterized protein LOC107440535 [Parasteatoda tepidariorum]
MCDIRVDSADILLVVKALERLKNRKITSCSRHENEKAYFDNDEAEIEKYETLLRSAGKLKTYFTMESIVEFKNIAERLSTDNLKQILAKMSLPKALTSCGRLLIDHHEENLCSLYLSSALKLYLKAFESVKHAFFYGNGALNEKMLRFLRLSSKHRLHQDLYVECLRVFCVQNEQCVKSSAILEDILSITHAAKIDIFNVWSTGKEAMSCFQFCSSLFSDINNIVSLIQFGKTDCVSVSSYLHWWNAFVRLPAHIATVRKFDPLIVRSLQVLHLYLTDYFRMSLPFAAEYVLKLFWSSITDPYLTREEFQNSFLPECAKEKTVLRDAWTWYEFHVLGDMKDYVKNPRSLRHLSRCSVRDQMAWCLQLPSGVERLPGVSAELKNYILLKNCISSFFVFS